MLRWLCFFAFIGIYNLQINGQGDKIIKEPVDNATDSDSIILEYRILGFDDNWKHFSTETKEILSHLPAGTYQFQLRGRLLDEDVRTRTALELTIEPPFWETWSFRIMLIVLFGIVLFLIRRYEIKKKYILKQVLTERQKAIELERARISRDFHDGIGTSLSQIAISAEVAAKKLIKSDLYGVKYEIDFISECIQEIIEMLRDIIWALDPTKNRLDDLTVNLRYQAARLLQARGIKLLFNTNIYNEKINVTADFRRNIFFIAKEALMNVCKHSKATQLTINISTSLNEFYMLIRDDGSGFCYNQYDTSSRHKGLENMKARASAIDGTLSIAEEKDKGTIIKLQVPIQTQK